MADHDPRAAKVLAAVDDVRPISDAIRESINCSESWIDVAEDALRAALDVLTAAGLTVIDQAERDRLAATIDAIERLHEVDEDNHCVTCSPQDGGRPCCTLREILDLRYGEVP